MTRLEIFKKARIVRIDRANNSITAIGIDTISGRTRNCIFEFVPDRIVDKAERFMVERTPIIIDVDSSTKNIDLRVESSHQDTKAEQTTI